MWSAGILGAMPDQAERLRALHRAPPIFVLPNAWDAASARLFEAEGFPAIATTSAGVAAALGYPDGGVVPSREMIEAVARIARAVKVPVTADIEHAYAATPDAVAEVVLRVIAAGAVGINLEDYVPGATDLEPLALQVGKITADHQGGDQGRRARRHQRAHRCLPARARRAGDAARRRDRARQGVSGRRRRLRVRPRRPRSRRRSARWSAASAGPSTCSRSTARRRSPELEALGVARVSLGSGPMRAALAVVRDVARELKTRGTYTAFTAHAMAFDEVNELMK